MRPWKETKPGTIMYAKVRIAHRDEKYRRGFCKRLKEHKQILCTLVRWEDENYLIVTTHTKRSQEYRVHKFDCDVAS